VWEVHRPLLAHALVCARTHAPRQLWSRSVDTIPAATQAREDTSPIAGALWARGFMYASRNALAPGDSHGYQPLFKPRLYAATAGQSSSARAVREVCGAGGVLTALAARPALLATEVFPYTHRIAFLRPTLRPLLTAPCTSIPSLASLPCCVCERVRRGDRLPLACRVACVVRVTDPGGFAWLSEFCSYSRPSLAPPQSLREDEVADLPDVESDRDGAENDGAELEVHTPRPQRAHSRRHTTTRHSHSHLLPLEPSRTRAGQRPKKMRARRARETRPRPSDHRSRLPAARAGRQRHSRAADEARRRSDRRRDGDISTNNNNNTSNISGNRHQPWTRSFSRYRESITHVVCQSPVECVLTDC
jgi:hypothetical protein